MTRKILSWLSLVICEAIMIAAFIIFGGNMPTEVMILDIVVCTVILGLFFFDVLAQWDDEHTAQLGSMGVRWTVGIVYAILAVGVMVMLNSAPFRTQLLVQSAILVVLLLGLAAVSRTREQIVSVHKEETQKVGHRDDVKREWRDLLEKMDQQTELPKEIRERTNKLVQDMRYLAPTNNAEALDTDQELVEGARSIGRMIGDYRMNNEQLEQKLSHCERLMQRRRNQYSN